MKAKRFFSLLLSLCMLFTVSLDQVSAEDITETAPTITPNKTTAYSGQTIRFDFTNVDSTMEFGVLPGNASGNITAYNPIGYKALSSSVTSQSVTLTEGYYVAAIWKSGWDFQAKVPITVVAAPVISVESTKIEVGTSVKFSLSNLESGMEFGVLPGDSNGAITAYSPIKGYKSLSAGTATQTVTFDSTGYYVAAIWKSGWDFVAKLPITVAEGLKVATLDKATYYESETITVTTKNWSETDGDFFSVYDGSVTDITEDTEPVYTTKDNPGQSSYSIDTTNWAVGDYRLVAFDSGDYSAEYILDTTFTVKVNKMVTMDKSSYTTDDVITVTTKNWTASSSTGEFIRIYKLPISAGYNAGVLADTYGTVWGKDTYKFYTSGWEVGEYQLIAFEHSGWGVINKVNFTVTAPDEGAYTVSGESLTINEDIALDFSSVEPETVDGKLFIGWLDSDGNNAVNGKTYTAGTVLTAKYIDYNADDTVDFKIVDTEIRTDFSRGLRFVAEQSNSLYNSLPKATEYGIAVLPSDILNNNSWAELELGREYIYGNSEFATAAIGAEKIYATEDDRIRYTACITGITDEKLIRQYTARGYIKYTDLNGVERVLYTDYASANPYETAKADLKADDISEKRKASLEEMVATVKANQAEKYDVEPIAVAGSANDTKTYVYQLGENGIYVRDAIIEVGLDTPIEIMQLSDLHFNYLNAKDYAEKNPTVLSTADMRLLAANGKSAKQARAVVDYARTSDAVVVTGDIFDYLSWGGIEMMYKEVWDIIPDAVMTVGNHEFLQKMLGVMPESLSAETRWSILQENWKHNIYYSSRVVDEKVMLIQLNNGEAKFYDSQIAPLTADIELAREKGYTVLMFMHEPICTGNSAESAVKPIRADDNYIANFYTSQVGGNGADDATASVYNLIKSNADVIKGVFNGHMHNDYYTEIVATTNSGESAIIPQYTLTGGFYNNGSVIKITVK